MKYFKVLINKGQNGLQYPSGISRYEYEVGRHAVDYLYYDEGDETRLILCIPDEKSAGVLRDGIVELTEEEAKAVSESNEKRTVKKTDPDRIEQINLKIQAIQLKKTLGIPLTEEESKGLTTEDLKALDPNDPASGFGMNKILADRIEDRKLQG